MPQDAVGKSGLDVNVRIYPVSSRDAQADLRDQSRPRNVGVCFSGGGSRSLAAVMGQLRGLCDRGWLDDIAALSAVSGGCWAAALYTFLPDGISDDAFLGRGVLPGLLQWDRGASAESLSYLPPDNLGLVATRLGWDALYSVYKRLRSKGFRDWHEFWRIGIGELVFQGFGLYQPDADENPTHFYSADEAYFHRRIKPYNPELSAADFYFARGGRPGLIMNGAMFYPQAVNSLLPVLSTLFAAGIRGTFTPEDHADGKAEEKVGAHGGEKAGGGFVEPYGFASEFISRSSIPGRVVVGESRPFSVVDMAAISSAAFAEAFWDRIGLKDLEPEYLYWPVIGRGGPSVLYTFADGGLLENTGLVNLLANTKVRTAVVFVNGSEKVARDPATWEHTQVPGSIPPLFGFQPIGGFFDDDGYRLYAGDAAPRYPLMRHNRIFPSERFAELLDGLGNASHKFQNTAMYLQRDLHLQPNSWFGMSAGQGRSVDVLWVCNNRVNTWERQITDPVITRKLDARHVPGSGLWNFPYYDTLAQLNLTAEQVNMLAQLSW